MTPPAEARELDWNFGEIHEPKALKCPPSLLVISHVEKASHLVEDTWGIIPSAFDAVEEIQKPLDDIISLATFPENYGNAEAENNALRISNEESSRPLNIPNGTVIRGNFRLSEDEWEE